MSNNNLSCQIVNTVDEDVLQEIPDEDLPKLRDIMKKDWPYACQAYFFLDRIIKWKNMPGGINVKFLAPNGIWADGTFLAITNEWNIYKLYFFTLTGSEIKFMESLSETRKIQWSDAFIQDAHEKLIQPMMDILIPKINIPIRDTIHSSNWWLDKNIAENYDIICPDDVYISPLAPKMSEIIDSLWYHRFPGSDKFIKQLVERNGGLGIFSNDTNELRSWITLNEFGGLATLQTLDQYKRRGYAELLVKEITKNRAKNGLDSVAFIVNSNVPSISLFSKLGFVKINDLRCIRFEK